MQLRTLSEGTDMRSVVQFEPRSARMGHDYYIASDRSPAQWEEISTRLRSASYVASPPPSPAPALS